MISGFVRAAVAAALLTCGLAATASAMSVSPVHVEMTGTGNQSRSQVTVHNNGNQPMPVETSLQRLQLDENGERKLSKAGEDFLVFPPQALIPPGGTQVFRLQWVGNPALAESESYMFQVSQVPVQFPKGQSKVQVVMNFGVVINVAGNTGSPILKVTNTGMTSDKQGKKRVFITVENPTKTHALLPEGKISLVGAGWSHTMTAAEINEKVGIGLVQPGKRRKFVLPVDLPANVTSVQASLDYKPKR
jgi:fimbrial chaperone protein